MKIKEININNLRNHSSTKIEFSNKINVIRGNNGMGKTTILEAISIASLSKTFLSTPDASLIKNGENSYQINLLAQSDVDVNYKVNIEYSKASRKKITSSIGENLNPKDIIGIIPIVVLSPDNKSLTYGAPSDRRQFLDTVLSQSSKLYINDSLKLKKILKLRNALLSQNLRDNTLNKDYFEILTEQFIKTSIDILIRRIKFIDEFLPIFRESYLYISNQNEIPNIIYEPDNIKLQNNEISKEYLENQYWAISKKLELSELKRGTTLFGPQRDDMIFTINNLKSKDAASQGQHKSLLIAIKLAEYNYLSNILNETPIILFDDIFSELDANRSNAVFSKIVEYQAQTIITMTNSERLMDHFHDIAKYLDIYNGELKNNYV